MKNDTETVFFEKNANGFRVVATAAGIFASRPAEMTWRISPNPTHKKTGHLSRFFFTCIPRQKTT
jgi:L-serine deaminase